MKSKEIIQSDKKAKGKTWSGVLVEYKFVVVVFLLYFFSLLSFVSHLSHVLFLLDIQNRFHISTAPPCRLHSTDTMDKFIIACIILHSLIIVDKWEDPDLDQRYLKEGDDFVVDVVQRGIQEDSQLIAKHISKVQREYMSYKDLWNLKCSSRKMQQNNMKWMGKEHFYQIFLTFLDSG